jgi:DinB family protein
MATAANPYAKYLAGRDALEVLAETPERLKSLVDTLGPTRMNESYAPGKWTLNTVLCHLADCELAFGYRWRQVVAEPHHTVQTFDQDAWAANYRGLDAEAALTAFCANRTWNVNWLKSLTPDQLAKPLSHPERGELTLRTLFEITAGHDLNHLRQFEQVVAAKAGY